MKRMKPPQSLAEYQKRTGMTQAQIAEVFDVDQGTISRIINGKSPRLKLAKTIHRHTGIPILNLLYPKEKDAA